MKLTSVASNPKIIGASEAKPLSSGWCETGSHGTSKPDGTTVRRGGAYHLHVTGQPLNPRRRVL